MISNEAKLFCFSCCCIANKSATWDVLLRAADLSCSAKRLNRLETYSHMLSCQRREAGACALHEFTLR
jgi:hypothetical protein